MRYIDGSLYLNGMRSDRVRVYDMNGGMVSEIAVPATGYGIFPLDLPGGMYVVTDGIQSVKIFANFAH